MDPLVLPCGRRLNNRLTKVALYEHLGIFGGGPPNEYHFAVYSEWAKHNWGMIFTGNVAVVGDHLTLGRDIVVPDEITDESLAPFRRLASAMKGTKESGTLAIMQLNHAGRQSLNYLGGRGLRRPLAPSPIGVGTDSSNRGFVADSIHRILFSVPKEMTKDDIEHVITRFAYAAQVAHESGFDGIELHAAHGYLIAQFLSPKSNKRTDEYSLKDGNELRLLQNIVSRIRAVVPREFVVGIKLNASDYAEGYSSPDQPLTTREEAALNHIATISQWGGVDFIEISGGDYESLAFVTSSRRQALFSKMSHKAYELLQNMPRKLSSPPLPAIMLTGGLKTPALIQSALANRHAQIIGIGRAAVLRPDIPKLLQSYGDEPWPDTLFAPDPKIGPPELFERPYLKWVWNAIPKVSFVGGGIATAWYNICLRRLAERSISPEASLAPYPDYSLNALGAAIHFNVWIASKATTHKSSTVTSLLSSFFAASVLAFVASSLWIYYHSHI